MVKKLAVVCLLGLSATPAFAAKGDVPNGQPFQALQAQIDANQTSIAANAAAIETINVNVDNINLRIDGVEADIVQIRTDVDANAAAIAETMARVSSTENDIQNLSDELAALEATHAADADATAAAIAAIKAELVTLNNLREALADDLNAQLAALQANVDSNTFAIDGLVIQLVSINAQLTGVNSDIMGLENGLAALEVAQAANEAALADLGTRVDALEVAVSILQSHHLYAFSGIATNVPVADLNGWTECYKATYADRNAHPENMVAACTGNKIMLACRPTGSDTLTVAAYADRSEVFHNTGDGGNVVHTANGTDWYFSYNYSMGFAPVGEGVSRTSADTQNRSSPHRLSWHTHDWHPNGWRCGSNVWLNGATNWEKLIYQAD